MRIELTNVAQYLNRGMLGLLIYLARMHTSMLPYPSHPRIAFTILLVLSRNGFVIPGSEYGTVSQSPYLGLRAAGTNTQLTSTTRTAIGNHRPAAVHPSSCRPMVSG